VIRQRSQVTRSTLVIGTGTGLLFGSLCDRFARRW